MNDTQILFEEWLAKVDVLFIENLGLGYQDFPDWDYSGAFEDGLTPKEAFEAYQEEYQDGLF